MPLMITLMKIRPCFFVWPLDCISFTITLRHSPVSILLTRKYLQTKSDIGCLNRSINFIQKCNSAEKILIKNSFLNSEFYFIYQSANISINYLLIVGSWIVALKFIEFIFHHYINISHSVDFYVVQAFTSHMDHIDHMIWPI